MLNRRSFLAAVMGAAAVAPVVVKALPAIDTGMGDFKGSLRVLPRVASIRHYTIYDSLIVKPGQVVSDQLFPPPCPREFILSGIQLYYDGLEHGFVLDSDATVTGGSLQFHLVSGGKVLAEGPLFLLGHCSRIAPAIYFGHDREFTFTIDSYGREMETERDHTVQVVFQGLISKME